MRPGLRKTIIWWTLALLVVLSGGLLAAGCGEAMSTARASEDTTAQTVTDLAGRTVRLTAPTEKLVALGPSALRLVCYMDAQEQVVGIENFEKRSPTGRPYILAHPELLDLPIIGQGGPDSTPDPEMLLEVAPDVIFVAYLVDGTKADELQKKTGIPVVVLDCGPLGTFDDNLFESLRLVGQISGNEERARQLVEYIQACSADLAIRTDDVPQEDEPSVYVGGLGYKGTHGIESTSGDYPPLRSIGAENLVDETGVSGSVMIDKEQLIVWDPDVIFLDEVGLPMVAEDYDKNPGFYDTLTAFSRKKVYGFMPFNYYTTNVGTALADAYFMGKMIFPQAFSDIDPAQKADEIYSFLLGEPLYERMAADFGGFRTISLDSF